MSDTHAPLLSPIVMHHPGTNAPIPLDLGVKRPNIHAVQAALIVARYRYGLSLHELARRESAAGQDANRKQLSGLIRRGTELLLPVAQSIRDYGLAAPILTAANITIANRGGGTRRFWGYLSTSAPAEPNQLPMGRAAWFQVTPDRRSVYAKVELQRYGGMVQAAPSTGYEAATKSGPAALMGCWRAIASRARNLAVSETHWIVPAVLQTYDALRQIEARLAKVSEQEQLLARRKQSLPILEELHEQVQRARDTLPTSSPLAEFVTDIAAQWDMLSLFIEHPGLAMENGAFEKRLKTLTQRDPWIFTWHPRAPLWSATIFTIIESCAINGVHAEDYIGWALSQLELEQNTDMRSLLPWNFPAAEPQLLA